MIFSIFGEQIPVVKGKAPAGKYAFMIGASAPGKTKEFAPEQARFTVTAKKSYFNGNDFVGRGRIWRQSPVVNILVLEHCSQFICFWKRRLGLNGLSQATRGIVFTPAKQLKLQTGTTSWIPQLTMRDIRAGYGRKTANDSVKAPEEFRLSAKQRKAKRLETQIWLKRMKMGRSQVFSYGHAFTRWWDKYGKTHPEYFALTSKGERAPYHASKPDRIKLCISNPEVHKLIVANFVKSGGSKVINTCENDSGNYCECKKCRALDATSKGEKFDKDLDAYYQSWVKAGAKNLFLRPNDMHIDPGLPMGFEKKMFDNFQICMKYGAFGTDYDAIHNFWPVSGIANYIIARAIAEPDKSFYYWENEYCSTYGPAATEVKKYYHYWRKNIFE